LVTTSRTESTKRPPRPPSQTTQPLPAPPPLSPPPPRVKHVALKSASPQVRKFVFVAPQHKVRFSKAQLGSLHFKLLDATPNHNFYGWIWYSSHLDCLL
jgi:hypothetical protein